MNKKVKVFFIIYLFLLLISIVRIVDLVLDDKYKNMYIEKSNNYIYIPNKRGRILDCNGNVIVDNKNIYSIVYQKPKSINYLDEISNAKKILEIIDFSLSPTENEIKKYYLLTNKEEGNKLITSNEYELYERRKINSNDLYKLKLERVQIPEYSDYEKKVIKLYYLMNNGYSYDIKEIVSDVSVEEYANIMEKSIPGFSGVIKTKRFYPYGDTLRSILGNVKKGILKEDKEYYLNKGYSLNDEIGISYLEKQYEDVLRGTKSIYKVNYDNSLTLVKKGTDGDDITLAIDIELQQQVDDIIDKYLIDSIGKENTEYFNHTYVIIADPNTGEIKALSGRKIIKNKKDYTINDISNLSITSAYTMGSSVKAATQAVGYNNGLITNKKVLDKCIKLKNVPMKCSYDKELGYINDIDALTYSSNSYQYQLAIKLTNSKYTFNGSINATKEHFDIYRNTLNSYGLGVKTGIDLPNEQIGLVSKKVSDDLLLNFAIGQLDSYTPVQMSQYINTVANNGNRIELSLRNKQNAVLNRVEISEENMIRVKTGLRNVIVKGTGRGIVPKDILAAGKTGTSESMLDIDNNKVVDVSTITRVFLMYAPFDNPKYSMVVITPDISHNHNDNNYSYPTNVKISREVAKKLFEKQ